MNDADSNTSGRGSRWEPDGDPADQMPTERLDAAAPMVALGEARQPWTKRITAGRARTATVATSAVVVSVVAGAAVGLAVVNAGDAAENTTDSVGPQDTTQPGGRTDSRGGGHHGQGHHR